MKKITTLLHQIRKFHFVLGLFVIGTFASFPAVAEKNKSTGFALFGDTGYAPENEPLTDELIDTINGASVRLAIHVGDFQGFQGCSDETYDRVLSQFNRSAIPFIYTPGDNDWADCWGPEILPPPYLEPAYRDPLDALASVRNKFFPTIFSKGKNSQGVSLGQTKLPLIRQSKSGDDPTTLLFDESKFIENQMWVDAGVLFATFHTVGGTENCLRRTVGGGIADGNSLNVPDSCSAEKRERQAANVAWIKAAFVKAKAEGVRGVVLATQQNMDWNITRSDGSCPPIGSILADGLTITPARFNTCKLYEEYQVTIGNEAKAFGKPVALMWGSSHFFRYFKPIPDSPNLVAVQTTGIPNIGFVRVNIDKKDSKLFSFSVGEYCVAGANHDTGAAAYCRDTYGISVMSPQENSGNFEGFEMGLKDPTNNNAFTSIQVDSLPGASIEGDVVYVGRGCPDPDGVGPGVADTYLANPTGKFALIDRGGCRDDNKVAWAQINGAKVAIIANNIDAQLFTIFSAGFSPIQPAGSSPDVVGTRINIPALGVYRTVADKQLRTTDNSPVHVKINGTQFQLRNLIQLHGD